MFRLSQYLRGVLTPPPDAEAAPHAERRAGPVVIWNLIRRCNLACRHCYSASADIDFPGELTTAEAFCVLADLKAFRVPALILSGGEPLLRRDLFEISARAKELGLHVALSTNGALIDDALADRIRHADYGYVGVSLDGVGATHDRFRGRAGAFEAALAGLRRLRDRDVRVGVRFTMTQANAAELPALLDLVERERVSRFYLSHLVYAGRGRKISDDDAEDQTTRAGMDFLIERAWSWARTGRAIDVVTGNNDADAVYLLHWVARRAPGQRAQLRTRLARWGGNASGVNIANIDERGDVHPDTMWRHHTLGNVRARSFSAIWRDLSDPIMAGLNRKPRTIGGRCAACAYFDVCGGNTRVRALRVFGDPWAEDPGCYLSDAEIAVGAPGAARSAHRRAPETETGHAAPLHS